MYAETLIKTRVSPNTSWCPEPGSDYIRVLHEAMRADGRLINILIQTSENQLQQTRTMIFRSKADRDRYFGDPIIAALEQQASNYDLTHQIGSRIIADGE
jgi:hypothetical protein